MPNDNALRSLFIICETSPLDSDLPVGSNGIYSHPVLIMARVLDELFSGRAVVQMVEQ